MPTIREQRNFSGLKSTLLSLHEDGSIICTKEHRNAMVVWNTCLAKHTGVLQTLFLSLTGILFVKVSQYRFSSKVTFSDFHLSTVSCYTQDHFY